VHKYGYNVLLDVKPGEAVMKQRAAERQTTEGHTFVVETRGFNDRKPIGAMGNPLNEAMHVTERIRRRDLGHLDYDVTFDDPQMYTRKFTVGIPCNLLPDNEVFDMFCGQNEKDRVHMVK
jgi:hypothetical protein